MKEQILRKTAELFLSLGVKSVTMDDIASSLGISKKTLYTHFPRKAELVKATAFHVFDQISAGVSEIKLQQQDPIDELYAIKDFVLAQLNNQKTSPQYQLKKYYPKISAMLRKKQLELMQDLIEKNLNRGIMAGLYRRELDIDFITRIYFIGIIGIKDRDLFFEDRYAIDELMEKHLEYHFRAIITPQGLKSLQKRLKATP